MQGTLQHCNRYTLTLTLPVAKNCVPSLTHINLHITVLISHKETEIHKVPQVSGYGVKKRHRMVWYFKKSRAFQSWPLWIPRGRGRRPPRKAWGAVTQLQIGMHQHWVPWEPLLRWDWAEAEKGKQKKPLTRQICSDFTTSFGTSDKLHLVWTLYLAVVIDPLRRYKPSYEEQDWKDQLQQSVNGPTYCGTFSSSLCPLCDFLVLQGHLISYKGVSHCLTYCSGLLFWIGIQRTLSHTEYSWHKDSKGSRGAQRKWKKHIKFIAHWVNEMGPWKLPVSASA